VMARGRGHNELGNTKRKHNNEVTPRGVYTESDIMGLVQGTKAPKPL